MIHILFAALVLITTATGLREGSRPANPQRAAQEKRDCSLFHLGELLNLDSTKLRRAKATAIPEQHAEGARAQAYFDGNAPRIVVATFFGESGRSTERYFIGDSLDFVVDREEMYYRQPLDASKISYVSRVHTVYYFCGGSLVQAHSPGVASRLRGRFDRLVARLRPAVAPATK